MVENWKTTLFNMTFFIAKIEWITSINNVCVSITLILFSVLN